MWIFFIPSLEICCSEDRGASVEYLDVDGGLRPTVGAPSMAPRLLGTVERPFYIHIWQFLVRLQGILPLRFATSWNSTAPSVTVLTWSDWFDDPTSVSHPGPLCEAQAWWCFHDFKNRAPGFPQHQETPNSFFVSHDHLCCKSWPQTGEINAKLENQPPPPKIPHRNTFLTWHFPRIS